MRRLFARVLGLALYAAVVGWCGWQLPASLPFVGPAAAAGAALHGLKGRPWLGLTAFVVLVLALPVLLAPALGTGAFSDVADWFDRSQS
ncbi:hypothetical protein [Nocardioides sp. SYSU D00065]|uniref:hypothetical protein n=1 Tax=Nocardioides sp. SYSU D00065 TaxID=2817378 RepID=UPI001B30EDD8|nr:hypothetical protein [Nocardioides sp. SYSU D00065]